MQQVNGTILKRESTIAKPKILNFLNKTEIEDPYDVHITHVDDDSEKPWTCGNCNRQYKWRNSLKFHLRNECGVAPRLYCQNCGYKTNVNSNLKRHKASCKSPVVTDLTVV